MRRLNSILHVHVVMVILLSTTGEQCGKDKMDSEPCAQIAIAKDFAGLDGCGMLFLLDSGKKLLPTNLAEFTVPVRDGERVRISFREEEEMMSICMAEDAMVTLTCLARHEGDGWVINCPKMLDPYAVAWSEKVMQELDPRKVEELYLDGQLAYRYSGKTEQRVYDCTGRLLCASPFGADSICENLLLRASDMKIIYVVNE